jgi:TonB-dependent starch-binding outer membrane protein SusC
VIVANQDKIDVILGADVKQLEAVEIVGYTKLDEATEVQKIEKVTDIVTPNVANSIQGKATGVNIISATGQPGAKTNIRVRGVGSISGSSDPLYVIDGVIMNSSDMGALSQQAERDPMSMINPNDIEDIRILKDAAATALYGARAANGVVVITTKKGSSGATKFNITAQEGITTLNKGNFEMMDADQYIEWMEFDPAKNVVDEGPYQKTDWGKEAFRTGRTSNYQLSASGGNDKTKFYASGGYFNQEGILVGSEFERFSARLNLDNQVTDNLKFSLGTDLSFVDQNDASNGNLFSSPLLGTYLQSPIIGPKDSEGNLIPEYWATPYGYEYAPIGANFLYDVERNSRLTKSLNGGLNGKLMYFITPELTFSSTNAVRFESLRKKNYTDPTSYDGADSEGSIYVINGLNSTMTTTNLFTYEKRFNDVHNVTALGGMEYQYNFTDMAYSYGEVVPIGLPSLTTAASNDDVTGSESEYRFISLLSQLKYSYDDRYFVSASYRRDGASRFSNNHKFGNFYSVGGTWMISNEDFMEDSPFSSMKLYASYGTTGNAAIGNYQFRNLYTYGSYTGKNAATWTQLGNQDLTWEKKHKANIGLDFTYNDWLTVNANLYNERSTDLLLRAQLSSGSGFTSMMRNVGAMTNRGVELMISTKNLDGELKWNTDFNLAFNQNVVNELYGGQDIESSTLLTREGESINTFFLQEWAGANPANGKSAWFVNGEVTEEQKKSAAFFQKDGRWATTNYQDANKTILGSALPKVTGGLTNTLKWNNFDASVFLTFAAGNKIYNGTKRYISTDYPGNYYNQMTETTEDRWEKEGDNAFRPAKGDRMGSNHSSRYLEDGSYISLRNISLGYTLPAHTAEKLRASNVRLFASAQNLFTLTKYSGYTPTTVDTDGWNFFEYPEGRVFSAGLSANF